MARAPQGGLAPSPGAPPIQAPATPDLAQSALADLPATSLVIVSRGRPECLYRCLIAVSQLAHPRMEVIVIADDDSAQALARLPAPLRDSLKQARFGQANIALARNLGLGLAAGAVVAFLDDDACPEPGWLAALSAPFADASVLAAGGPVRGRNGISWQWQGGSLDAGLRPGPLPPGPGPYPLTPGRAIEIKGTNCAYRRETLAALGGFDPAIRYYLDESALNLRLAALCAGRGRVAWVPGAVVHHDKAASAQRRADLCPRSLYDIGRSSAVTLRRQAELTPELAPNLAPDFAAARARMIAEQLARLRPWLARGALPGGAAGLADLMAGLVAGWAEGLALALPALAPPPLALSSPGFRAFPAPARPGLVLAARVLWAGSPRARAWRARAAQAAAAGRLVTLILLSPGLRRHRMRFDSAGFWEQNGGIFGRSRRDQRPFPPFGFRARVASEVARIGKNRPVG